MNIMGKTVAISLGFLGVYYAFLGSFTLLNLADVSGRWIQVSGDPDFKFDQGIFAMLIGFGAASVLLFGLATVACGTAAAVGRIELSKYWIVLAIAAPFIHFPWFLYRRIATGTLPRGQAALATRTVGIRFAAICAAYIVAYVLVRRHADRMAG